MSTPPEAGQIAEALGSLLDEGLSDIGAQAVAYVRAHHTASEYARRMVEILRADEGVGPREQLVKYLASRLLDLGLSENVPVVDAIAQRVEDLFGREPVGLPLHGVTPER